MVDRKLRRGGNRAEFFFSILMDLKNVPAPTEGDMKRLEDVKMKKQCIMAEWERLIVERTETVYDYDIKFTIGCEFQYDPDLKKIKVTEEEKQTIFDKVKGRLLRMYKSHGGKLCDPSLFKKVNTRADHEVITAIKDEVKILMGEEHEGEPLTFSDIMEVLQDEFRYDVDEESPSEAVQRFYSLSNNLYRSFYAAVEQGFLRACGEIRFGVRKPGLKLGGGVSSSSLPSESKKRKVEEI